LPKDFIYKKVSERVKIPRDRAQEDSDPFYMERVYFNNAGLFFFVQGDHLDRLEAALHFLQFEGIGTDRNVGNGFFEFSYSDIELGIPQDSEYSSNLGLYYPDKEKVKAEIDDKSAYELIKRGGWITTPGHMTKEKKSVYMFSEGSIFKKKEAIDGIGNIDLTPEGIDIRHNIYRSGKSLFIPVKI
jgi:CRISPR-associated protein Csm4